MVLVTNMRYVQNFAQSLKKCLRAIAMGVFQRRICGQRNLCKIFEEMFGGHCDGSVSEEEEETDGGVPFINHFLTPAISDSNNK